MKQEPANSRDSAERDYLGVIFDCCHVYSYIHKNKAGDAYVGWCPRCAKKVTIPIGPLGTDCRFFTVC